MLFSLLWKFQGVFTNYLLALQGPRGLNVALSGEHVSFEEWGRVVGEWMDHGMDSAVTVVIENADMVEIVDEVSWPTIPQKHFKLWSYDFTDAICNL